MHYAKALSKKEHKAINAWVRAARLLAYTQGYKVGGKRLAKDLGVNLHTSSVDRAENTSRLSENAAARAMNKVSRALYRLSKNSKT